MAYIVNGYRNIYPDTKELTSLYKLDKPIFTLPLCDQLQDMKNKGKLELYIRYETGYNQRMRKLADFIADKLGLKPQMDKAAEAKKKQFFKNILMNVLGAVYE